MWNRILALVTLAVLVGCSSSTEPVSSAGGQGGSDAADVGSDAPMLPNEAGPDATGDTAADTGQDDDAADEPDAAPDVGLDATPDGDTLADTGADSEAAVPEAATPEAAAPEAVACTCSNPGFCICSEGYTYTLTKTWPIDPIDGGHVPSYELECPNGEVIPVDDFVGTCKWSEGCQGAQLYGANGVWCSAICPSSSDGGTVTAEIECRHCWGWECSHP